jgi:2-alkyl-3-oxoalkanoate reductase
VGTPNLANLNVSNLETRAQRRADMGDLAKEGAKIFVTGAGGLVGFHLIKALNAWHVQAVAAVRATTRTNHLLEQIELSQGRMQMVTADLADPAVLAAAMSGCNVVVHTAATIDANGQGADLRAINVQGTRNALQAAIVAGVRHFVHISSLAVITGEDDKYKVNEEEPLRFCREPYANSKIEAEQIVMNESARGRIQVTALRPGFIYGPHERAWMPRVIDALRKGRALIIGDGSKETNVIYVENVCQAIGLAVLNPVAFGQVYNLTDGERVTKKRLFDAISDGLDLPRATTHIPMPVARILCELSSLCAPIAPPLLQAFLARYSRPAFRLAAVNQGFDISKAERELGYIHRISFIDGMARTLAAWKSNDQHGNEIATESAY